jgi:hypothetical protein
MDDEVVPESAQPPRLVQWGGRWYDVIRLSPGSESIRGYVIIKSAPNRTEEIPLEEVEDVG